MTDFSLKNFHPSRDSNPDLPLEEATRSLSATRAVYYEYFFG